MISRHDKKSSKKVLAKHNLKIKHTIPLKNESSDAISSFFDFDQNLIRKKYIDRQLRAQFNDQITKLIQSTYALKEGR